jgi:hypothetical protein
MNWHEGARITAAALSMTGGIVGNAETALSPSLPWPPITQHLEIDGFSCEQNVFQPDKAHCLYTNGVNPMLEASINNILDEGEEQSIFVVGGPAEGTTLFNRDIHLDIKNVIFTDEFPNGGSYSVRYPIHDVKIKIGEREAVGEVVDLNFLPDRVTVTNSNNVIVGIREFGDDFEQLKAENPDFIADP